MIFSEVRKFLEMPLLTVSGTVITPGSLLLASSVVAGTMLAASLSARWSRRILKARGMSVGLQFSVAKILRYVVIVIGCLVAADSVGLKLQAFVAASAVIGIGIGFGLQNIAQNFVSGLILLVEQPIQQGDVVKVGDMLGVVDDIGLRATRIVTRDEVTLIVPNNSLIAQVVTNHSRPTTRFRVHVPVNVAYESDLEQVRAALLSVAKNEPSVLKDPPAEIRFVGFGDSNLSFELLAWISSPLDDVRAASAVRFALVAEFKKQGIEMPFPQSEIHVRSVPSPTTMAG